EILTKAVRALNAGGRIFVREVDAALGLRARFATLFERVATRTRYNRAAVLAFRPASEIVTLLRAHGLACDVEPASAGSARASVLVTGKKWWEGRARSCRVGGAFEVLRDGPIVEADDVGA